MDNFIVSARKYRPAAFNTVVGQSAITNTLKNAIKNQQVAQAFLFTGPRGVGKTTCARILAKTINCTNITADGEACDTCPSCTSFNKSSSFNIFELDAASNNSVEDIRALVDQVRIPPQHGYKVYIIDEVHMLSQQAFNAFLKTLEEPPSYAKFILATTEKHKILPTILSRCQIFDFRRIGVDDIASHLQYVSQQENISAETEALHIIAQKADGGLRDALSMFDQLVSYAGNNLTYKQVIEHLNVLDYDYYFRITNNIIIGNISETLLTINEIFDNGFEGQHFLTGLGEHMRNLLVSKDSATIPLLEISQSIKDQYLQQSSICSIPFLLSALEIINNCDINYKTSNNKKLHVEICLMQLCKLIGTHTLKAIPQPEANNTQPIKQQSIPQQKVSTQESVTAPATPKPVPETISTNDITNSNTYTTPTPPTPDNSNAPNKSGDTVSNKPKESTPIAKTDNNNNQGTATGINLGKIFGGGKSVQIGAQQEEQNSDKIYQSFGNEPVNKSDIVRIWPEMINEIANDLPLLKDTLLTRSPRFDNNCITVIVENPIQREEVIQKKDELTIYLRRHLKNDHLYIEIVIEEGEQIERKPYTDKDKYEYIVKKVPTIRDMKEQLGLDLEM